MLKVAELLPDKSFFIRMDTIPNSRDTVANDVKYHLKFWVIRQRKALKTMLEKQGILEIEDVNRVVADLDIIEVVRQNLTIVYRKAYALEVDCYVLLSLKVC